MNVNIYDVAKKSGLSVVTVSRVLNNFPSVREYNREKVLRAMEELGYNPNSAARNLAKGRTGIIGLMLPVLNDDFFNNIVKSVNAELARNGYFLALSLEEERLENSKGSNYLFQEKRVDGIIVLSPMSEDEYILELKKKNIPFVLLDNQKQQNSVFSILVDNYKGGCLVAEHLMELGHRKISFINGPDFYLSSRERRKGFIDTLASRGMQPYEMGSGEYDADCGYNITKTWLKDGKIPTAIFAADDNILFGAVDAIREMGMTVPGDISVCGYDDDLLTSKLRPSLTTVRQPAAEMGKKAVELLIQLIEGKTRRSLVTRLEPELIKRESTSIPRKS